MYPRGSKTLVRAVQPLPAISPHARVRMQQRGIRADVLDCLLAYGRREYNHTQCEVVVFDTPALNKIAKAEGRSTWVLAQDHRDVYAVVDSDGWVVTAGHRYKRLMRDTSLANVRPRH